MKKLLLLLCFITSLSFGAVEKKVYLMIPSSLETEDSLYKGAKIDSDFGTLEVKNISVYVMASDNKKVKKIEAQKVRNIGGEEGYDLLEVYVKASGSSTKIKLATIYEMSSKKHIILADEDTLETTIASMKTKYNKGIGLSPEKLISKTEMQYNYVSFPGYEIKENAQVFNTVIGTEKISTSNRVAPSNIIEKFGTGSEVVGGEINISPANSDKNIFVIEDNTGTELAMNDLKKLRIDNGKDIYYEAAASHIKFRVKTNSVTIKIDDKNYTLAKNTIYDFYNLDKVVVDNRGGNGKWYLSLDGVNVIEGGNDTEGEFAIEEGEMDSFYIQDENEKFWVLHEDYLDGRREDSGLSNLEGSNTGNDDRKFEVGDDDEVKNTKPHWDEDGKHIFYDGPASVVHFTMDSNVGEPPIEGFISIKEGSAYEYRDVKRVILRGDPGNNGKFDDDVPWYISFGEKAIEPEEVIILAGLGDVLEGSVEMTSGEVQNRTRTSDVNIDVLNNGFEVKSIKE